MKKKKILSVLLVLTILVSSILSGCNKKEDAKKGDAVAMGRYIETENSLPENLSYIIGIHQNLEGCLELIGIIDNGIVGFISNDKGMSWNKQDISKINTFFKENDGYSFSGAAWDQEDQLYLYIDIYKIDKENKYQFLESKIGYMEDT